MATKVLPLFTKEVSTQLKSPELDILPAAESNVSTMSSLEIAELIGKQHKHVIRDIEKIISELATEPRFGLSELSTELKIQLSEYKDKTGRKLKCYNLDRESALLLTSGYDVHLRLKIIRRLDELESGTAQHKQISVPAIPQSLPDALRLAATLAEEKDKLQIERDEAIKTKGQISTSREASVMGKLARANDKIKQLEMVTKLETNLADKISKISHATILAIQSRVRDLKANGLKLGNYCRKHGLEIQNIPEPSFAETKHEIIAQSHQFNYWWLFVFSAVINFSPQ